MLRENKLMDRLYCTGNFLHNILSWFSGTLKDSETKDNSFKSPNIELLEFIIKVGVVAP